MKVKEKGLTLLLTIALLLSVITIAIMADTGTASVPFPDIEDHWAREALVSAVDNGLLNGMDGYMRPDDPLTRTQLAAIINRAFGAVVEAELPAGTDVSVGTWYAADMRRAVQMGTLSGDPDGKFRPDDPITRQEAFAVLARAFKTASGTAGDLIAFSDADGVSPWAINSVAGLVKAGYVAGSDGKLSPTDNITRAQFATILDRMVSKYITGGENCEAGDVPSTGAVLVRAPGVTLKGMTVGGDLIIGDGVGDGDVTLDGVTVKGRLVVRGGGENSVRITGASSVGTVIVARGDGEVRVVVSGGAAVDVVYIDDGSDDVILEGEAGDVIIEAADITVTAVNATINSLDVNGDDIDLAVGPGSEMGTLTVAAGASGTAISNAGTIDTLQTNSPVTVKGGGTVREAVVGPAGSGSSFETAPALTTVQIGASANVGDRTIDNTSGSGPRSVPAQPPATGGGGGSSDTTAPSLVSGYPRAGAAQAPGSKQVEILVWANEGGTAYYVAVPDGAAAPSAAQVMAAQNGEGGPALISASGAVTANAERAFTLALFADATAYDVYVVVKDASGNATAAAKVDVTTPPAAQAEDPEDITSAAVAITLPVAGAAAQDAAAVDAATMSADYAVTDIDWSGNLTQDGKFKAAEGYFASITLTSRNGKAFQAASFVPQIAGVDEENIDPTRTEGAGVGNTVTFGVYFDETDALTPEEVTGIAIKTQPDDLRYADGEDLSLDGLVVTLTNVAGTVQDVTYYAFGFMEIEASPEDGESLTAAEHNGQPVVITCNGLTADTDPLTVLEGGFAEPHINDVIIPAGCYGVGDDIDVTIWADGEGYTAGEITINGRAVSDFDYVGQDGENYIYEVTYTVSAEDESHEGATGIPVSVILYNGTEPNVPAYTGNPVTNGFVLIDGVHPGLFTVDSPTTADNGINGDGKSTVTIYWDDASAIYGVDHYEVIASNVTTPTEDDTVAGLTDIQPGTQIAEFDWDEGETVYDGVVAVDIDGNKVRRFNGQCYVTVTADTVEDEISPTAVSFSPENGAMDVAVDADLVLTFSENVTAVAGKYITIFKSVDDVSAARMEVTGGDEDGEVSVSGGVVTTDLAGNLAYGTDYYVWIDAGAFIDVAGNPYAGITDGSTWAFATEAAPVVPAPVISAAYIEPGHYNASDEIILTIMTDGEGYTAGIITVNGRSVSDFRYVDEEGGDYLYEVTYTVESADTNRASVDAIPISVVLRNGTQACEPFTGPAISFGTVEIDTFPPAFTQVNVPASTDNVIDGDGKSAVTITWTDSEATDVGHYEVFACDAWRTPIDDDLVEGLADIAPGTETATFDWPENTIVYVAVAAVDDAGNKTVRALETNFVTVVADTESSAVPPTVESLTPAAGAENVACGANLVMVFDKNVIAGEGTITIWDDSESGIPVESIAANSARVSISGATVTIDPVADLAYGTDHYVIIEEGAFVDGSANPYAGIGTSSWYFTVMDEPAAPVISGVSIAPGLYGIDDAVPVTITADGAGYTAGAIMVNLVNVSSTLTYVGEEDGSHIYRVTYTPTAAHAPRASVGLIPISVVLMNAGLACPAYTAAPTSSDSVVIDTDVPTSFTVNAPTTGDNGVNGDGKSSVAVTWTDSAATDVDHYEVAVSTSGWPTADDTVEGLTNIAEGVQTATFDWAPGVTLYVSVIAVDDAGNKGRWNASGTVVVAEDTPE